MAQVHIVFFSIAMVLLLGFGAARLFRSTRIPDVPMLLCLGLLLGPLNFAALESGLGLGSAFIDSHLNIGELKAFAPFVSSLALVVILFDSGLKLDFAQFSRSMRPALFHTIPLFTLTVLLITGVAYYVFGMPPLVAAVLGVALSNVGQTVSAGIIRQLDFSQETRSIYFIEMALYDLISIPILTGILQIPILGNPSAQTFFQGLAQVLAVSLFVGIVGGLIWIQVLLKIGEYPYTYMVTLASLLLVYSINSFLGGSGPVSVLVFGLIIGNRRSVLRMFRVRGAEVDEGEKVQTFHDEITFFVRSFFFIYLGLTFTIPERGNSWNVASSLPGFNAINGTGGLFLIGVLLIFGAIVAARYLVVTGISARGRPELRSLIAVYGRGLGTAVLATFPFTLPSFSQQDSYYHGLFAPWEAVFTNASLLVILLTVAGTGLTVWMVERNRVTNDRGKRTDSKAAVKE